MEYDFSEDAKLREALQQIINFVGINIEIAGCWIWADGNTYGYKDALKNIGFKWAREKKNGCNQMDTATPWKIKIIE